MTGKIHTVSNCCRRLMAASLVSSLILAPLDVRAMEGEELEEKEPLINTRRTELSASPQNLQGEAEDIEKQLEARRISQTRAQIIMEKSDNCWMVFYHLASEWFGLLSLVTTVSVPILTGLSHYESLSSTWQNNFGFASYFVSALAICFASLVVKTQVAAKNKEQESENENAALRARFDEIQAALQNTQKKLEETKGKNKLLRKQTLRANPPEWFLRRFAQEFYHHVGANPFFIHHPTIQNP